MASLSDIYKKEKSSGGTLGTAMSKRLGEKIDPRQLINQSGILPLLFPSLKSYKAIPEKSVKPLKETTSQELVEKSVEGAPSRDMIASTMMTAKNTMGLPLMARDINLMKINIAKMTKVLGASPEYKKTDMFWKASKAREDLFESSLGKMGKKAGVENTGKSNLSKALSFLTGKKERDGKTKGTALFVETVGLDVEGAVGAAAGAAAGAGAGAGAGAAGAAGAKATGALAKIKAALPFIGSALLPIVGLSGLVYLFYKMFNSKGAFLEEGSSAVEGLKQAEKVGGLAGVKDEEEKRKKLSPADRAYLEITDLEKHTEDGVVNNAMLKDIAKKSPDHATAVEKYKKDKNIKEEVPKKAEETKTPVTPAPAPAAPTTTPAPASPAAAAPAPAAPTTTPAPASPAAAAPAPAAQGSSFPTAIPSTPAASPSSPTKMTSSGVSEQLVEFLKNKENPKLAKEKGTSKASWDYKQWSIGYGTKAKGENEVITEGEAEQRLRQELEKSQKHVVNYGQKKGYSWNQGQIDALTSFVYNLGPGQLDALTKGGTRTNEEIAQMLPAYNKAGGKVLGGLTKRRQKEVTMFAQGGAATQSAAASSPSVASSTPTSGSAVSSASTSVADNQRTAMAPSGGGGTSVIDNSTKNTVAAAPQSRKDDSAYDTDLIRSMVSIA